MPLDDTSTIDLIAHALDDRPQGVDLVIIDSAEAADEVHRHKLFLDKLGTYVNYVMSPEFKAEFPDTGPTNVQIIVCCFVPPNEAMIQVHAVYPKGDRINRIPVTFMDKNVLLGDSNV